MRILITGGAGFIGSHFTKLLLRKHPDHKVTVLDALTYCGNPENLTEVQDHPNYTFTHGDIRDRELVEKIIKETDRAIHFAAETHVDRSIDCSDPFISTDIKGTQVLMEAARKYPVDRFVHISTSEVYGTALSIPMTEEHPLNPQSPYAAAKAGADRLAYSYFVAYKLPVVIVRPFNNYGPNQFPEKLLPLFITNALEEKSLPVYGNGTNTRDWLYVTDCCEALEILLLDDEKPLVGEVINLGTGVDTDVLTISEAILNRLGKPISLIQHVGDRPGHVERLISSTEKAEKLLGWRARTPYPEGLKRICDWFVGNPGWWKRIKEKEGEFQDFYQKWYSRL